MVNTNKYLKTAKYSVVTVLSSHIPMHQTEVYQSFSFINRAEPMCFWVVIVVVIFFFKQINSSNWKKYENDTELMKIFLIKKKTFHCNLPLLSCHERVTKWTRAWNLRFPLKFLKNLWMSIGSRFISDYPVHVLKLQVRIHNMCFALHQFSKPGVFTWPRDNQ